MSTFKIDEINSDEECLYVDIPNADKTIVIKIDNQEVILDIYPMSKVVDQPIKSIRQK